MRQQGDGLGDITSNRARIDCSEPVLVRAEYGPDSDVRNILRRHGGLPNPARQPQYRETDDDLDLTVALHKIEQAHKAFNNLPAEHRERFRTVQDLWTAYKNDELHDERQQELPLDNTRSNTNIPPNPPQERNDGNDERNRQRPQTGTPTEPQGGTPSQDTRGQPR